MMMTKMHTEDQNNNKFLDRRSSHQRFSIKKVFLKISQNSQMFSCEYCETFKNTYFEEHLRKSTSKKAKNEDQVSNNLILTYKCQIATKSTS